MPIVSRRTSRLLLAFSFFLIIAPAVFSPPSRASELGGASVDDIWRVVQLGVGAVMFTVWLYQFRKGKQSDETVVKLFTDQLKEQNETTKLAFVKYNEHTEQLLNLLKTNQEQNMQIQKDGQRERELLAGTLSRLEVRLEQPVVCPYPKRPQSQRSEVTNG